MCSRHRESHGADSDYTLRPYIVWLEDDDGEGDRIRARIPAAIGPRDAESQARDMHPYYVPLRAEVDEAELDFADAELDRAKVPDSATFDGWMTWAKR